jgi:hypothetical protein
MHMSTFLCCLLLLPAARNDKMMTKTLSSTWFWPPSLPMTSPIPEGRQREKSLCNHLKILAHHMLRLRVVITVTNGDRQGAKHIQKEREEDKNVSQQGKKAQREEACLVLERGSRAIQGKNQT